MFLNLYKQNIDEKERQEFRRKTLLEKQKQKRLEQQDEKRHLEDPHHNERAGKFFYKKNKNNRMNIQDVQLQLSEWFRDKPDNLDNWLLVPCPKGQRCLIVAAKGETKMYSKNKRYRMTFSSLLPGGGLNGSNNDSCILDCIYNKESDQFYVLDAISLCIPLVDCDAEFRFFWLKSKFNEFEDLKEKFNCNHNDFKCFQLLDYYDMSNEERVAMALQRYPLWLNNRPEIDGFLFYHKESNYEYGTTPLVCWLFPFMLPDVLEMTVSEFYKCPANYCKQNPWHYMNEFDKEQCHKKFKGKAKLLGELDRYNSTSEQHLEAMEECENQLSTSFKTFD